MPKNGLITTHRDTEFLDMDDLLIKKIHIQSPRELLRFLADLKTNSIQEIRNLTLKDNQDHTEITVNGRTAHLISDPDIASAVLTKPEAFQKPNSMQKGLNIFGKEGIFSAKFHEWKTQRSLISPHFNLKSKARDTNLMCDIIDEELENLQNNDQFIPYDFCRAFALRILCRSLFSTNLSSEKALEISQAMDPANERMLDLLTSSKFLTKSEIEQPSTKFKRTLFPVIRFIHELVEERLSSDTPIDDALGDIIEKNKQSSLSKTDIKQQIKEEIYHLLLAGHETTGATTAWCLYHLAYNQEMQAAFHEDVVQTLPLNDRSAPPKPKDYSKRFISETLRLHPAPYVAFPREVKHGETISGINFSQGDLVFICIDAIHQNPKFYKDAEMFNPDNFTRNSIEQRPKKSFMPFLTGAHTCPGQFMSLQETFIAVSSLLEKFSLEPTASKFPEAMKVITASPEPIPLYLTRRC